MKKFLAFFSAFLLLSSASYGGLFSSHKGRDLVEIFEEIEARGPDKNSVEELEKYIEDNPRGYPTDEALIRLGRIYSGKKENDRALQAFQRIIDNFPDSRFRPDALYEAGFIKYKTGRLGEAKSSFESVLSSGYTTVTLKARAAKLLKEMEAASYGTSPKSDAPAIGAILPLKDNYTQFGEDALNGVLLAAQAFGGKGGVEVFVRSVTDAQSAETAVGELANNPRVVGIVGPLLSATALNAAKAAQAKRIPVITLTQKEGVTDAGDYVFRNFMTPAAQASAIAEHACKNLNLKKIAVLYPQNNYGTELAKLFEKEAIKNGCEIVKEGAYPQGVTDFSPQMKSMFEIQVKERKEGRRKIKEYTPNVTVDALYIPDSFETVSLILPYLEFYNIKGVQLLGSNGWNSQKLIDLAGKHVEGAVFVDSFFSGSSRPETGEFAKRFKEVYGKEPGVLEAQAYDAAFAIISSMDAGSARFDREEMKRKLKNRNLKGATGDITFDSRNEAVKKLFILTVRGGRIIEAPGI